MDEITLVAALRPDAPDETQLNQTRAAARRRLVAASRQHPASTHPLSRWPASRWPASRWLASGLVAATAGAVAIAVLLASGGTPAPRQTTVVTAAWTVRENTNGTVTVRIQQFEDPARLQQVLRDDGINAFAGSAMRLIRTTYKHSTYFYPSCKYQLPPRNEAPRAEQAAVVTPDGKDGENGWTIHPSAMRPGSALFLTAALSKDASVVMTPVVLTNDTLPACVPAKSGL
jgi:hypothetical protein